MIKIAPSILSADFSMLGDQIKKLDEAKADFIHIDVMDGSFVPNISFGIPIIKSIRNITSVPFDTHLMIEEPSRYIEDFINAGSDIITVHYEADRHIDRTISYIKNLGAKAGIAINPGTPVYLLEDIICNIDMVLIMSVNPGYGGQKFINYTYEKIKKVKELSNRLNPNILIEVDGGVDNTNIKDIVKCGANVLVAGSYAFKNGDILGNIKRMRKDIL